MKADEFDKLDLERRRVGIEIDKATVFLLLSLGRLACGIVIAALIWAIGSAVHG